MTEAKKKPVPWEDERAPLKSKKFLFVMVTELSWKAILLVGLLLLREQVTAGSAWMWWFMITTVIVAGFVEVGFIGGQAWLDKYVRVAHIMANGKSPTPEPTPSPETPTEQPPTDPNV